MALNNKPAVVELSDSRLLSLMKSSLFTTEFPFLRTAFEEAKRQAETEIPKNCPPCQRKRLMTAASRGRKVNFEDVRRTIRKMPNDKLSRMKQLLRAKEVRVTYQEANRKVVFKF